MESQKVEQKSILVPEDKKQRGAGMVEYAILAAIVVGLAVVIRNQVQVKVSQTFSSVGSQLDTLNAGSN